MRKADILHTVMNVKINIIFSLLLLAVSVPVYSGISPEAGTAGAAFLKIAPAARPAALSGAFVSFRGGVESMYWNPAGIAGLSRPVASAGHSSWFEEMRYDYVNFAVPSGAGGAVAVSVNTLDMSGMQKTLEDSQGLYAGAAGSYSAADRCFILTYARTFGKTFSAGLGMKEIRQRNAGVVGRAAAFDAGGLWELYGGRLRTALALLNAGPREKMGSEKFRLPMKTSAGVSWLAPANFTLALDLSKTYGEKPKADAGCEYRLAGSYFFRAGYSIKTYDDELGAFTGMSAGFGFARGRMKADYAFVPYGDLGNTHRISLSYFFGAKTKPAAAHPAAAPAASGEAVKKIEMERLFNAASVLYREGRYAEAIEKWKKVLSISPGHQLSKQKIAKARAKLGWQETRVSWAGGEVRTKPGTPRLLEVKIETSEEQFEGAKLLVKDLPANAEGNPGSPAALRVFEFSTNLDTAQIKGVSAIFMMPNSDLAGAGVTAAGIKCLYKGNGSPESVPVKILYMNQNFSSFMVNFPKTGKIIVKGVK